MYIPMDKAFGFANTRWLLITAGLGRQLVNIDCILHHLPIHWLAIPVLELRE